MAKITKLVFLLLFLPPPAMSEAPLPSQIRGEDEDYEIAWERYRERLEEAGEPVLPSARTAYSAAVPISRLDLSATPSWDGLGTDFAAVVQGAFEGARDERSLIVPEQPRFPRRPSWLYPDDGCFARAAVTGKKLESWEYPRPHKLFIFGNLVVRTRNHPRGWVSWWYHVVPVIAFQGSVYVIDPAIEPARPLPWMDWVKTMVSNPEKGKLSLCNPYAYAPASLCFTSAPSTESSAVNHQIYFLRLEWRRLLNLGRNPNLELGEAPPWWGLVFGLFVNGDLRLEQF